MTKVMLNTLREDTIPLLREGREYVFCLEDLELAFEKQELKEITSMWNAGASIEYLSKRFKRNPDEVFLALFHQARRGWITRKFGW